MELKRILLVDDSAGENFLHKLLIKELLPHCELHEAPEGRTALKLLSGSETCPDVIFLDINMPVMDGLEFLQKYAGEKKCEATRIYMLTSSEREEDRHTALSYTFVKDFFSKPL